MALGHRVEIIYSSEGGKTKKELIGYVKQGSEWVRALPE